MCHRRMWRLMGRRQRVQPLYCDAGAVGPWAARRSASIRDRRQHVDWRYHYALDPVAETVVATIVFLAARMVATLQDRLRQVERGDRDGPVAFSWHDLTESRPRIRREGGAK